MKKRNITTRGGRDLDVVRFAKSNAIPYADAEKAWQAGGGNYMKAHEALVEMYRPKMEAYIESLKRKQRKENPIDWAMLGFLIGTKPVTAEIQKVGRQIRLKIDKPSSAMLHKLGLRRRRS